MGLIHIFKKRAEWVIGTFLFSALAFAIWGTRRGWDLIDGGAYFLSYKYPSDVIDVYTSYNVPGGWALNLVADNIVLFRFLSWLLVLGATLLFYRGFIRQVQALWPGEMTLYFCRAICMPLLISGMAPFISSPAALTYNSLNVVCMLAAIGLVLSGTARTITSPSLDWRGLGEFFLACVITGLDIVIKPTTSILLFAAIALFCLLSPLLSIRLKAWFAAMMIASGFFGSLAIVAMLQSWTQFKLRIDDLAQHSRQSAYTHDLLTRVMGDFRDLGNYLWADCQVPLALFMLGSVGLVLARRYDKNARSMANIVALLVATSWLGVALDEHLWKAGHDYFAMAAIARFYIEAVFVGAAIAVMYSCLNFAAPSNGRRSPKVVVHLAILWLMLVLLPFAGSFGTTNPIYLNAGFHAACWAAAMMLTLMSIARQLRDPAVVPLVLLPFAAFATAQFINGYVLHPYEIRTDLFEQDTPTEVGSPSTTLLLDAPTSSFIRDTRRILENNGFKPGDDIFAFFNMPGLVYAVGGRSPVIPWYFGRIYSGDTTEEMYMKMAGELRRRSAWIITQADVTGFRDHFHRGGLDFPENYSVVGELTNPADALDVKIWKNRDAQR